MLEVVMSNTHNTFILYGALADKYGSKHMFTKETAPTMREAINMIEANFKGFKNDVKKWNFHLFRGENKEKQLATEREAFLPYKEDVYHFVPVIEAHKSQGGKSTLMLIIGVILIVAFWWAGGGFGGAALISSSVMEVGITIGISLAISGIAGLLSGAPDTPDYSNREDAANRPSHMFSGCVNVKEQGGPVPVVYGDTFTGSVVVGVSMNVEDKV